MVIMIHLLAVFDSSVLTFKICQKRVPGNFKMNSSNICIETTQGFKLFFTERNGKMVSISFDSFYM